MSYNSPAPQLESYKKLKVLGKGSYGKAFLVECSSSKEFAVIKKIDIKKMSEEDKRATLKEAKILEVLNHPNIIRFKEVYKTKAGQLCIVMDYADGGDLDGKIKEAKKTKKKFTEVEILLIFTQVCLAMKHVHDRKIIHRDIKTQNIFLTKAGIVKVGDFGVARVMSNTKELAATVIGTPYYLSPEIVQNNSYDQKTDIWSLGVLLFEMCAFKPPFNGQNLHSLAIQIVSGQHDSIPESYSAGMKFLISRLLTVDPAKRPTINDVLNCRLIAPVARQLLNKDEFKAEFRVSLQHAQFAFNKAQKTLESQVGQAPQDILPQGQLEEHIQEQSPSKQHNSEQAQVQRQAAVKGDVIMIPSGQTLAGDLDPSKVAMNVLNKLDNIGSKQPVQRKRSPTNAGLNQAPIKQQPPFQAVKRQSQVQQPFGAKPFSQAARAGNIKNSNFTIQGQTMDGATLNASKVHSQKPGQNNHKNQFKNIKEQREYELAQKRQENLKKMQQKQILEEQRKEEIKRKAQELRDMKGQKGSVAAEKTSGKEAFGSTKKAEVEDMRQKMREDRRKAKEALQKKAKANSKVEFELVGCEGLIPQPEEPKVEEKKEAEKPKQLSLSEIKRQSKNNAKDVEVEIKVSDRDLKRQEIRELEHYRKMIDSVLENKESSQQEEFVVNEEKKQDNNGTLLSAEFMITSKSQSQSVHQSAKVTTADGSDGEEYEYSEDEEHNQYYQEDFNTMLEEAAMDQANYQDDRDDDDYDLDEQDYSVTMSDQSYTNTIQSVVQEDVLEEHEPQKPSDSALNPKPSSKSHARENQNTQSSEVQAHTNHGHLSEEDNVIMNEIIESRGRAVYELMYQIADKYKLERFKEETQLTIKKEVASTLEQRGDTVPSMDALNEIFGLVSSNMIIADFSMQQEQRKAASAQYQ